MLYDEKIEALIRAALTDGVLTEKEKQILIKKAQMQGIDLDEFEMVLDARLVEIEKEEKENTVVSTPKSTQYGDVRKCPSCGSRVPALAGVCPKCGYEFSGVDANLTSKQLAETLERITREWDMKIGEVKERNLGGLMGMFDLNMDKRWDINNDDKKWELQTGKYNALAQAIRTTPIPNTKSDLFEFITMTQAAFLTVSTPFVIADAYHVKYNEAMIKVRSLYHKDDVFGYIIHNDEYTQKQYCKIHKSQPKHSKYKPSTQRKIKFAIGFAIFMIADIIFLVVMAYYAG